LVRFYPIYISAQSHSNRGFAYGLLDVLNPHFQTTLNITAGRASGLSAAYFGAYFLCPPTISGWILRKWGFRVTFMSGLLILSVGCLLMWYANSFPTPLTPLSISNADLNILGPVE
jgi:fucose permease